MAGAAQNGSSSGMIVAINVTPLVDIALVLLIVFMVTAKLLVTPALPLELPRASHTEELQTVFAVSLPLVGPTLVNGQPVAGDDALVRLARNARVEARDLRAVISADGAVTHRRVIHILDLIKTAGIARVAFAALPPDPVTPR